MVFNLSTLIDHLDYNLYFHYTTHLNMPTRLSHQNNENNNADDADALLYACLVNLKSSPAVHPSLRNAYSKHPIFDTYVTYLASTYFATPATTIAMTSTELRWSNVKSSSGTGRSGGPQGTARAKKTARELDMERKGRLWMFVAGGAIVSYLLLSGQYIEVQQFIQELGEDDDGEEF